MLRMNPFDAAARHFGCLKKDRKDATFLEREARRVQVLCKVKMIMVCAAGVKATIATGTGGIAGEVLGDSQLTAAGAA